MELTDLKPNRGARRKLRRVGRGRASGHGKTSTRGHNGQGQRSGESKRFGFEGGQTPLFRRLPKIHNFDQVVTRDWVELNVGALNALPANSEVTPDFLVEQGLLNKHNDSLRILGNGDLKVALKVSAHHISAGAKAKIEAAGGSATVFEVNKVEGKRAKRLRQAEQKWSDAEAKRLAPKPVKTDEDEETEKPKKKEKAQGGGGGAAKSAGGGKPQGGGKPAAKGGKPGDKTKKK
ncbi:MAG: 50S ribosomal protein L15 [Candidatus Obscuribacterales bacterium]|nr:50S ribosomal protein L15 [Cyanobacteria bacterium SZAS LIN-5]RTL44969.1 MAG: 50S ribosomal protein L15 [Candidatus Melainabacteria bacterium]